MAAAGRRGGAAPGKKGAAPAEPGAATADELEAWLVPRRARARAKKASGVPKRAAPVAQVPQTLLSAYAPSVEF